MGKAGEEFERLKEIVHQLRDPKTGCPWDKEQTHESLTRYLIEETYETIDAIESKSPKFPDELGDVLLQVMLHSEIASETKKFSIEDVVRSVADKMIKRHPHVFGEVKVENSAEVLKNWEQNKKKELAENHSILDGVPRGMPALLRAERTGEKAARVGFEWPTIDGVKEKVTEEVKEFLEWCPSDEKNTLSDKERKELEEEFGDILFALTQLSRRLKLNSEDLLHRAIDKFTRRFKEVEKRVGPKIHEIGLDVLDSVWNEIKKEEKKRV